MNHIKNLGFSLISLLIGFAMASLLALAVGESPLLVVRVLFEGSFGSITNFGYSLFYATPLIFTGLSVSWAFRTGLFNIGAEGQMALGGLAMTWICLKFANYSPIMVIPLALVSAFITAGLWGSIAGWMKAYRGAHEVLITIMLNYIAYGIVSFCVAIPMRNLESQAPETSSLAENLRLWSMSAIGGQSPLNISFLLALSVALVSSIILNKTVFGFRTRFVGEAPITARFSAVPVKYYTISGMFIAGGFAGLAGMSDILGYSLKLREGFTGGAGFIGIAVALMGRNSAIGVILSAILFGALQKGALALDLETEKITRDLAVVIQAFIIFAIVSEEGIRDFLAWLQSRRIRHE